MRTVLRKKNRRVKLNITIDNKLRNDIKELKSKGHYINISRVCEQFLKEYIEPLKKFEVIENVTP